MGFTPKTITLYILTEFYNSIRDEFNEIPKNTIRSAALFIWLNAHCYRGLWRVSKANAFNVPFHKERPNGFYNPSSLRYLSNLLTGADLRHCSYERVCENGLIYLDPPYANVFQKYGNSPPSAGDLQRWIEQHRDSTILISNNQHYTPPANAILLYKEAVFQRVLAEKGVKREEYLYGIFE